MVERETTTRVTETDLGADRDCPEQMGSLDRSSYELFCPACGAHIADDGLVLDCPRCTDPSLLRTVYRAPWQARSDDAKGLGRYALWLPTTQQVDDVGLPHVYHAQRLGRLLGLSRLWVVFSGYWPERGVTFPTATFKDLEASTAVARLPPRHPVPVLASAGNAASAFARAFSQAGRPCVIVLPASAMARLRTGSLGAGVRLVTLAEPATYIDALALARRIADLPGYCAEGGVRNVARRDGVSVVLLAFLDALGALPDHYVQAVGSGTGPIGIYDAAKRLGEHDADHVPPRMMLCQHQGFAPLRAAWHSELDEDPHHRCMSARSHDAVRLTPELTNPDPAFAIGGGLRGILTESRGEVWVAGSGAAQAAMHLFQETEGVEIEPPAGIALACLRDAARSGGVREDSLVLLHVTGGGAASLARDTPFTTALPTVDVSADIATRSTTESDEIEHLLQRLDLPVGDRVTHQVAGQERGGRRGQ